MNVLDIQNKISPVLKEYGVKRAAVFGSVSRGDDGPRSDIDIMVSLENRWVCFCI